MREKKSKKKNEALRGYFFLICLSSCCIGVCAGDEPTVSVFTAVNFYHGNDLSATISPSAVHTPYIHTLHTYRMLSLVWLG